MSAAAIIDQALELCVSLRVENGKVKAKGPRPAVEHLLPALREHKSELLAILAQPAPGHPGECSGHWLIGLRPERMERWFSSPVTRSELEQRYPGALLIALPETATEGVDEAS